MGAPKQKWTPEEEEALRRGVLKHGAGNWRTIQKDPEFNPVLSSRSNIDLKDKWRNLSFSASGLGSREKIRLPKIKGALSSPSSSRQPLLLHASKKVAGASPLASSEKSSQDGKTPPRYGAMIIEALSAMQAPNGSDIGAIFSFIEQRHEVPPNFRRLLSSKLRRLLGQNKIEKVDKAYKLKDSCTTKSPIPKQNEESQNTVVCTSTSPAEEAAVDAAIVVADAEDKACLASDKVMEAERILKIAEETKSLLMLAREIYERCSQGEVIMINQAV